MKITKELKDIIDRKLNEMEAAESQALYEKRSEEVERLNTALAQSDEFKALQDAARAWEAKVEAYAETHKDTASRLNPETYYSREPKRVSWNMRGMLAAEEVAPFTTKPDKDVRFKYMNLRDSIIMKLSYGKDFDEAKAILAEYGISI